MSLLKAGCRSNISNRVVFSHWSALWFQWCFICNHQWFGVCVWVLSFPIPSLFSVKWLMIWKTSFYNALGKTNSDFIYFPYFCATRGAYFSFICIVIESLQPDRLRLKSFDFWQMTISVPVSSVCKMRMVDGNSLSEARWGLSSWNWTI